MPPQRFSQRPKPAARTDGGVYLDTPTDCVGCHREDFASVVEPIHVEPSFSTNCLECHTEIAWQPSAFDHNTNTGFLLNGAHTNTTCISCHTDGVYLDTPTNCIDCHKEEYNRADDPNHAVLALPTDCLRCHTELAWQPAEFDHSQFDFALGGAHLTTTCISCHTSGVYIDTPTNCIDCHQEAYNNAADPDHPGLGFPSNCLQCHTIAAWQPADFDHNTRTDFTLNGAHINTNCISCHTDALYDGTPTNCNNCHQEDYNTVADPNHAALGFPTDCTQCHTEVAWKPADFDHSTFAFALNGAHATVSCSECHSSGVYQGTPSNCIDCHQAEYSNVANPIHVEPSFSTNCLECHTETAWTPSTFDHNNYFPINNGNHRRYSNDCIDCHLETTTYSTFSCIDCHDGEHQRNDMDDEHRGINNYRYQSAACLDCHPDGDS